MVSQATITPVVSQSTEKKAPPRRKKKLRIVDENSLSISSIGSVVEPEECPICFEPLGEKNYAVTACDHKFCLKCLIKSLNEKSTCPLCRGEIEKKTEESVKILEPAAAGAMIDTVMDEVSIRDFIFMANMFPDRSMDIIKMMIRTVCVELSAEIILWYSQNRNVGSWRGFYDDSDSDSESESGSDSDSDSEAVSGGRGSRFQLD